MSLELLDFMRSTPNALEVLETKYAIHVKRHTKYSNLILLKYNQIESPLGVKLVQQCRGIILDEANNWNVVSFPYTKFFNYGEGHAAEIDWSAARVYEKVDGSLMVLYYYDGHWEVSSSGLPDASGDMMGTTTTFADLFWQVWKELEYKLDSADKNVCYMFELATPFNRIVVQHKENKIVLHGARRLSDFRELNPVVEAHNNGWECVKTYPLGSWDEIVAAAKDLNPMQNEGYVVCDSTNYNRVKVKGPQYVAVAHMRDGFTTRRMLEIIRTNENQEFLSYFPEYKDLYHDIKAKYEFLVGKIEGFYEAIKHIDERKQFALLATTQKFSGTLFGLKYNKFNSARESIAEMNIQNLEEWLDIKSIKFIGL